MWHGDRPRRERLLVWTLAGVYLLVIGIIHRGALHGGWVLMGDEAIVVLRSGDLFSSHTPLIGMPSSFSSWADGAADPSHPGPTTLWVMGLGTSLFGTSEAVVLAVTWAISAAVLVTIVATTLRLGGARLALFAMGALMVLQLSMHWPIWSPLTPVVAIQPMLALSFLSWAIASGRHELWPWWLGFGAFVIQADLSFVTSILPLFVLIVATTIRRVHQAHRDAMPRPIRRSTIVASVVVATITWVGPFLDALVNFGGNFRQLYRAAQIEIPTEGISQVPEAIGALLRPDALANIASSRVWIGMALIIGLAGIGLVQPRTGRPMLALTAILTAAGAVVGQSRIPIAARDTGIFDYPLEPASAFLGFAALVLAADGLRVLAAKSHLAPSWRVPAVVVAVPVVLLLSALARQPALDNGWYLQNESKAIAPLMVQLDAELPDGRYRWQPLGGPDAVAFAHALNLRLLDLGIEPRVEPPLAKYYDSGRAISGDESGVLYLTSGPPVAPTSDATLVARWPGDTARDPALERLRTELAKEIRQGSITLTPSSTAFGVGTIAAGSGALADSDTLIDDEAAITIGKQFQSDPAGIKMLPDHALVELAAQRMIVSPDRDGFQDDLDRLNTAAELNVWFVPADR